MSTTTAEPPFYPMTRAKKCPFDPSPDLMAQQDVAPLTRVKLWDGRRIPTLRLATDLDSIPFKTEGSVYGVHELPVTW